MHAPCHSTGSDTDLMMCAEAEQEYLGESDEPDVPGGEENES